MGEDVDSNGKTPTAQDRNEAPKTLESKGPKPGKRSVAKLGMTLSMGALVATGMMRGRGAKVLHLWSGLALIGFSAWHYQLYQPEMKANRKKGDGPGEGSHADCS